METDLETEYEWKRQELSDVLIGVTAYFAALLAMGPVLLWMLIF